MHEKCFLRAIRTSVDKWDLRKDGLNELIACLPRGLLEAYMEATIGQMPYWKRKKHHLSDKEMISHFRTSFAQTLKIATAYSSSKLLKTNPKRESSRLGKVRVLLRISSGDEGSKSSQFLAVDVRKKHVTLYDPSNSQDFRLSAHKIFAFDSVFTCEDSQADICSSSLSGVLQGVVTGLDGCVFAYGYPSAGKSFSMLGNSTSPQNLGVMPSAVSWLFKLIDEHKEKTQSRFSVRVSAVEVSGRDEVIKDLLANFASGSEGSSPSPGRYLQEEVSFGSHLTELRAPNADKAAFLLDAAIAARTVPATPEDQQNSHFCFTLNVYQYRAEKGSQVGGMTAVVCSSCHPKPAASGSVK
ncbi:kinesin-like protein KIF26B [Tachypleus tridentatus]|uniref:kinesin-like protein KIF26B n=1 Tax=Tachypleus tridentatus TaxID=6853 RepID=UPI003FD6A6A8